MIDLVKEESRVDQQVRRASNSDFQPLLPLMTGWRPLPFLLVMRLLPTECF